MSNEVVIQLYWPPYSTYNTVSKSLPMTDQLPGGLISYGPDTNCTLDLCPVEWSVLSYRPSRPVNGTFIGLFFVVMIGHIIQGVYWQAWGFMSCMVVGCADEIVGYAGRIMLYYNPFSFAGFLIQIICITTAPLFYCAAIYVTLHRTILYLDPSLSRFDPRLFYWLFIPCDIISLALQAGGGAASSDSVGKNQTGVDVSLAGLAFQVFTLIVFILAAVDYFVRYLRHKGRRKFDMNFKIFVTFLTLSITLILIRCVYRIDELSEGYSGSLIHNQELFIWLEGFMIIAAALCLNIAHPGFAFKTR